MGCAGAVKATTALEAIRATTSSAPGWEKSWGTRGCGVGSDCAGGDACYDFFRACPGDEVIAPASTASAGIWCPLSRFTRM